MSFLSGGYYLYQLFVQYLYIAIVLLRLRVHYSVEIKHYKSQIRIRILRYARSSFYLQHMLNNGYDLGFLFLICCSLLNAYNALVFQSMLYLTFFTYEGSKPFVALLWQDLNAA